jgi:hypothetical protein
MRSVSGVPSALVVGAFQVRDTEAASTLAVAAITKASARTTVRTLEQDLNVVRTRELKLGWPVMVMVLLATPAEGRAQTSHD